MCGVFITGPSYVKGGGPLLFQFFIEEQRRLALVRLNPLPTPSARALARVGPVQLSCVVMIADDVTGRHAVRSGITYESFNAFRRIGAAAGMSNAAMDQTTPPVPFSASFSELATGGIVEPSGGPFMALMFGYAPLTGGSRQFTSPHFVVLASLHALRICSCPCRLRPHPSRPASSPPSRYRAATWACSRRP